MGGKPLLQENVCQDTCLRKAPDCFANFQANMSVVNFIAEIVLLNDPWEEQSNWDAHVFLYLLSGTKRYIFLMSRHIYFAFCVLSMLFQCSFDIVISAVLVVSSPGS